MFHFLLEFTEIRVALLAEGVDRNPEREMLRTLP